MREVMKKMTPMTKARRKMMLMKKVVRRIMKKARIGGTAMRSLAHQANKLTRQNLRISFAAPYPSPPSTQQSRQLPPPPPPSMATPRLPPPNKADSFLLLLLLHHVHLQWQLLASSSSFILHIRCHNLPCRSCSNKSGHEARDRQPRFQREILNSKWPRPRRRQEQIIK